MLCMICKKNVPDKALICPVCGAMPWQMPESFLNPEQHQVWLDTVYTPQRERWEKVLRLYVEIEELQTKNLSLRKTNQFLENENKALRQKTASASDTAQVQKNAVSASPDDFDIREGVLLNYKGQAAAVTIPKSVRRIADWSFSGCNNLRSVIIPEGVTSIGDFAFVDCISLESVTIPKSVKRIGIGAFWGCKKLRTAKFPINLNIPCDCFPATCRILRY